jgi:hypothetical protein
MRLRREGPVGRKGGCKIKKAIASSGAWSSAVVLEPLTVNGRDPAGP